MARHSEVPWEELFEQALQVRERAWAPYSGFKVGAAALFEDGSVFAGCNVENASYGLGVCAERNAIGQAVAQGKTKLRAVAVVADAKKPTPPCGACRQVIAEFAAPTAPVHFRNLEGTEARYTLGDLLPHAFTKDFL